MCDEGLYIWVAKGFTRMCGYGLCIYVAKGCKHVWLRAVSMYGCGL